VRPTLNLILLFCTSSTQFLRKMTLFPINTKSSINYPHHDASAPASTSYPLSAAPSQHHHVQSSRHCALNSRGPRQLACLVVLMLVSFCVMNAMASTHNAHRAACYPATTAHYFLCYMPTPRPPPWPPPWAKRSSLKHRHKVKPQPQLHEVLAVSSSASSVCLSVAYCPLLVDAIRHITLHLPKDAATNRQDGLSRQRSIFNSKVCLRWRRSIFAATRCSATSGSCKRQFILGAPLANRPAAPSTTISFGNAAWLTTRCNFLWPCQSNFPFCWWNTQP